MLAKTNLSQGQCAVYLGTEPLPGAPCEGLSGVERYAFLAVCGLEAD